MSTTATPRTTSRAGSAPTGSGRVGLGRVVRAEWTKLASLRSTWFLLVLVVVLGVGLATVAGWASAQAIEATAAGTPPPGGPPGGLGTEALGASILASTTLATLLLGVLGALTMSGEYSSGTITATLTAVPRRWPALAAKALLLVLVTALVGLVVSVAGFLLGELLLPASSTLALGDPGVWPAVLATAASMVATALLGLGLATVLRSTAGAITVLVALTFIGPPLLGLVPWDWVQTATDHIPGTAAGSIGLYAGDPVLSTTAAVLTLVGWALVPLLAGLVALQRRDA